MNLSDEQILKRDEFKALLISRKNLVDEFIAEIQITNSIVQNRKNVLEFFKKLNVFDVNLKAERRRLKL